MTDRELATTRTDRRTRPSTQRTRWSGRTRGTARRAVLGTMLGTLLLVLLLLPGVGIAQEPFPLDPGFLTDRAGAIDDPDRALAAINETADETNVKLVVALIDSFEGLEPAAWANETAGISGLGVNDVLLAVAVEDRVYAPLSIDDDFPLDDAALDRVAFDWLEPQLRASDWEGAVIATAQGLCAELGGDCATTLAPEDTTQDTTEDAAQDTTQDAAQDTSDDGGGMGALVWILLLVVIGVVVALVLRSRRGGGSSGGSSAPAAAPPAPGQPVDELDTLSLEELRNRAGALLVAFDDAIRESDQEASFAELEFGAEAVTPFRGSLQQAREALATAFALNQQLADAADHDDATQRAGYLDLIRRCEAAGADLERHTTEFQQLRDQRGNLPQALASAQQRTAQAQARVPELDGIIAELSAAYAPAAVLPVERNVTEAETRLEFATEALEETAEAQQQGDDNAAVLALRDAESAIAQAEQLIDAVHSSRQELRTAATSLGAAVTQLRSDITQIEQRVQGGARELAPPLTTAQAVLQQVEAGQATGDLDPVEAMARIAEVSVPLEQALHLDQQLLTTFDGLEHAAAARIQAVEGFISTRRGAVGPDARTRLAEASRALDDARRLRGADPEGAVRSAQHAQQLAEQASRLAERDVSAYQMPPPPPYGPGSGYAPGSPYGPGGGYGPTSRGRRTMGPGAVAGAALGGFAMGSRRRGSSWTGQSPGMTGGTGRGGTGWDRGASPPRTSGGGTRSTGGSTSRNTGGSTRRSGSTGGRSTGGGRSSGGGRSGGGRSGGGGRRGGGGGRF